MKRLKINKLIYVVLFAVGMASLVSCDTDPESLDINYKNIPEHASSLYASYLENLKEYRNQEHKVMFTWFENEVAQPVSRAHHLTTIPDSVDVICLTNPQHILPWHLKEKLEVNKRGTKVIARISYSVVENEYKQMVSTYNDVLEELEDQGVVNPEEQLTPVPLFEDYCTFRIESMLKEVDQHNLDGISAEFMGKATLSMGVEEEKLYWIRQTVFTNLILKWEDKNREKLFVFEGAPHNLGDKNVLNKAKYIIVNTLQATSKNDLTRLVLLALQPQVPIHKMMVSVSLTSLDENDKITGFFYGQEGTLTASAVRSAAEWVGESQPDFSKIGLAITKTRNDYYNVSNVYSKTKEAIQIMNPSSVK